MTEGLMYTFMDLGGLERGFGPCTYGFFTATVVVRGAKISLAWLTTLDVTAQLFSF